MFYRRKLILAILELFGGRLSKTQLQKLLFIIGRRQFKPSYEFIPYKYGAYSYSANADFNAMIQQEFLIEESSFIKKKDSRNYLTELNIKDRALVNQMFLLFKNHDSNALVKYTYVTYPEFAINSVIAEEILNAEQLDKVKNSKPTASSITLYTIGYEGISLENYLGKLLKYNIKVLVDVRNNPISQKYGFSKSQLLKYCSGIGIEYKHFSELGIQSEERQELRNQNDYDVLFESYNKNTLPKTIDSQNTILNLLIEKRRIALTCFEANICQCHRKHLSEAITRLPNWNFELKHI